MGTTCRAKKPTDFGCDPDGSLIGNFVPSIQYTAPKEVFFAKSRQHQGEQGRPLLRLFRHYYVDQALRYFVGYLCGVYRFTGCRLCLHIVVKVTRRLGARRGRRSATSSIGLEISTPTTEPAAPTLLPRSSEVWPQPPPMSIICSPPSGFSVSMAARPNVSIWQSSASWNLAHVSPAFVFQYSICAMFEELV